jgi:uncharacterized protein YoaH (UPF0181 family)
MDKYHETLGKIASYILSSDDTIRQSRVFQADGKLYKGFEIARDNNIISIMSTNESGYISVELTSTLATKTREIIDEDSLKRIHEQQQSNVNQNLDEREALDLHLRQKLPNFDNEETQAAMEEIEQIIDDSEVRLDWIPYSDTNLLNGFIIYTRIFPESLSIESYDRAVNRIRHYAPHVEDEFNNAFGSFLKEIEGADSEVPTGGGESEEVRRGTGDRGFA